MKLFVFVTLAFFQSAKPIDTLKFLNVGQSFFFR